ncbi:uncharacterized protein N7459_001945 [Penicillium hispanicum]|uniref:uncharacterized protein n=1 Tax=Penicillium hispanicum TaxID=1080232 RepID=UPI0025412AD6|nr:uncharacterized protein N7459_001945 [Penicillium hispanicum]KAJ5591576.1 hypothetical protein N7459_001945 [Penicillium hispanicum]
MTEAVRRRRSILRLAADTKNIGDYKWSQESFQIPVGVMAPPELHAAMPNLAKRALQAINAMQELRGLRDNRYNALCPISLGFTYDMHASSVKRLLEWREDWVPNDPSLAPSVKIPREALSFYLDPNNFATFASWYTHKVELYLRGPYSVYRSFLLDIEYLAARLINEVDYKEWRKWWDGTFKPEMFKWETCLEGLVIPTYEEVIDDVYLMVIDRVEDAQQLVDSLSVSHSPATSPQAEQVDDTYFILATDDHPVSILDQ